MSESITKLYNYKTDDLNQCLLNLRCFGQPAVYSYGDGTWSVNVKLSVSNRGAQVQIGSEYNCSTPIEAVHQTIERLIDFYKKIQV